MFALLRKQAPVMPSVVLSGEERAVVLNALERSARAMPDMPETVASHACRTARELRLAERIRNSI